MRSDEVPNRWRDHLIASMLDVLETRILQRNYAAVELAAQTALADLIPLIEAREREACVATAGLAAWRHEGDDAISKAMDSAAIEQLQSCINAIRAREQMTIDELIAALEAATGPSRELDEMIFGTVNGWGYPLVGSAIYSFKEIGAPYTASIDAALTLVPDGWCPLIGQNVHHRHWVAIVQKVTTEGDIKSHHSNAHTPAISLCIAALKARRDAA